MLNSKKFPLELHVVHFNSKYCKTFDFFFKYFSIDMNFISANIGNALRYSDGLAVVGFFYAISSGPSDAPFARILRNVQNYNSNFTITNPNKYSSLLKLVQMVKGQYFTYDGSLTTPTCNESVKWIVMKRVLNILAKEMSEFRKLKKSNGQFILQNFRAIQNLNGRKVFYNSRK